MVDDDAVTELVLERLHQGGTVSYVVQTGSMAPLVQPGDHIVISPAPQRFRIGDLVLRTETPRPIVHRVVAESGEGEAAWLITKGDAAPRADTLQPASVFVGVVSQVRRNDHTLTLSSFPGRCCGYIVARLSLWQTCGVGDGKARRIWRLALQKPISLFDDTLWWFAR